MARRKLTLKPLGRRTSYRSAHCDKARELCANGLTDREIADELGVNVATLYRWRIDFPEFRDAMKSGKSVADDRVERSLYARAIGYEWNACKPFMPAGASKPVIATYREHVPPDVNAATFWLKNRRGDAWRDKSETIVRHVSQMTDAQLEAIARGDNARVINHDAGGQSAPSLPQLHQRVPQALNDKR